MKTPANKKSIISTLLIIVMAISLTFALISCGKAETKTGNADIKGETVLETNEEGETVVVATDKAGKKVIYETNSKSKGSQTKATSASTVAKSTTAPTTTEATKAQVCYISIDGYCSGKAISIQGGDTAYSILTRSGASVSGSGSYVRGINGRFEFDEGPQSGWVYSVNGYRPNVGAGSYGVKAGDSISWSYVTSY